MSYVYYTFAQLLICSLLFVSGLLSFFSDLPFAQHALCLFQAQHCVEAVRHPRPSQPVSVTERRLDGVGDKVGQDNDGLNSYHDLGSEDQEVFHCDFFRWSSWKLLQVDGC